MEKGEGTRAINVIMWIKIQQMQQYKDIYSLQNYSTYLGCHSTHHRDWFVRVARDSHKPVPIKPRWRAVAVQVVWPVPEAAGTVFHTPDDECCDTRNM